MRKRRSLRKVHFREKSKWDRGLLPQDTVDLLEAERGRKIDVPRGGKMEGSVVREKIAKHGMRNANVLEIDFETIIDAAARRQKWIDQSQSVNLFLATPEMQGASARSKLNRQYRRAWDKGLKTTYYLRTLQASNIQKSTIAVKRKTRGVMGTATEPKTFTAEEKNACSLEAMMNGGTCEACPYLLVSSHFLRK